MKADCRINTGRVGRASVSVSVSVLVQTTITGLLQRMQKSRYGCILVCRYPRAPPRAIQAGMINKRRKPIARDLNELDRSGRILAPSCIKSSTKPTCGTFLHAVESPGFRCESRIRFECTMGIEDTRYDEPLVNNVRDHPLCSATVTQMAAS